MRQFNTLNQYPFLKELNAHEDIARVAQTLWQTIAPDNLASLSRAINIKNQQLNITTPYSSVAAKIKFLTPSLLATLKNQEYEVTAIQVKVQVKSTEPAKPKQVKKISPHAATNLNALATKLQGTPLGEALAKLAVKSSSS